MPTRIRGHGIPLLTSGPWYAGLLLGARLQPAGHLRGLSLLLLQSQPSHHCRRARPLARGDQRIPWLPHGQQFGEQPQFRITSYNDKRSLAFLYPFLALCDPD